MAFLLSFSPAVHHPLFTPSPSPPLATARQPIPRVSLQEQQSPPSDSPLRRRSSVWVNPNSPHASRLRLSSSESRHSRLSHLASSLSSAPAVEIPSLLLSSPTLSEQDATILLNLLDTPESTLASLRWFLSRSPLLNPLLLYNVALKNMRRLRNLPAAESLLSDLLRDGLHPDNITFSTLISCARACNAPDVAVQWFERMPEFDCRPDDVTYSVMIDAYGRSGNVETALALYDRARAESWHVDAVTFSTVIKIHGISGNFDGALNVFEEMKAVGVRPNLVTYNTLLDAMGRAGRPWQVKNIYKEMISRGIAPNHKTYAALLRAYAKARYPEDALGVYREMKEKGIELNVVLYNTLLSMCADMGLVDEAMEVFEDMKGSPNNCKPDSWTFSSLITIYSCSGQVSDAEGVLDQMVAAGIEPNIFVLTSLIQCYGKAQQTDNVVKAFDRVMELGIFPDDRFCGCLLNVMTQTPEEDLGKILGCINRANGLLGSLVMKLTDQKTDIDVFKREAEDFLVKLSKEVRKAYCNCLIDICINLDFLERACILLDLALRLDIYNSLQSKSSTQWSLHVRSLSLGASLTALHVWMNDLSRAMEAGEELPPLLGIHTGHGRHKYSEKGLAAVFQSHLRDLNAPFHESTDKTGWFLTTRVAAELWLQSRSSPEIAVS